MQIWDAFPFDQYLSLVPWAKLELKIGDTPGPFPFLGGTAPEVMTSLLEARRLLSEVLMNAIQDVVAGRVLLGDPKRRVLVEDAYAELIQSQPQLRAHIRCRRESEGAFYWEFPKDPTQSTIATYVGMRVVNSLTKQE